MSNALWLDNLEVISMTTKGDTKTVKAAILFASTGKHLTYKALIA